MSKCENCIYCKRCIRISPISDINNYIDLDGRDYVEKICPDFKDKSLFVELPCAIGETVYMVDIYDKIILKREFNIHWIYDFGKTVFLTKEDAEKKLKEIEGK